MKYCHRAHLHTRRQFASGLALGLPLAASVALSACFSPAAQGQDSKNADAKQTKVELNQTAPDFAMTGIDGKEFKLSDRLGKKNVVLMFSRARW